MKKPLLTSLFFLASFSAFAAEDKQQIINQQNKIIQRQQQFEVEKERQKQFQQIDKDQKEAQEEDLEISESGIVQDLSKIQCFRIKKIIFSDNKIISKLQENILTQGYLNKCLVTKQIRKLNKIISDYLTDQGFVTSSSSIPAQDLSKGTLKIEITESYLEEVIFNEDKFFDKTQKFTAFGPIKKDVILNLKQFEQGLDQVNRLRSSSAEMKFMPGDKPNHTIIKIENHPKETSRINLAYDNAGNEITGQKRDTLSFAQDNFLHLNDSFNISRTSNDLDKNKKEGYSSAFSSSFAIPFSWYNLTFSYSKNSYGFIIDDAAATKISGTTSTKSIALDRILIKNNKFKISSNFLLTSRYNQIFNAGIKDEFSRKASIASASLSNLLFFKDSTLFLKPTYNKSLAILDARKDDDNLPSKAAHAEFDIFKLYGNYSKKIIILQTPASYNLTFDSQISKQKLYGIDQFSVGGIYSVRGFREGSIANDSGYNIKNEFTINLGQTILPHLNLEGASPLIGYLNLLSVAPFYDYGYIRSKGGSQDGRLSGTGIKTSFNHKNFNASLTFSWAVSKSQHLLQNTTENKAIYFDIGSEFGFF